LRNAGEGKCVRIEKEISKGRELAKEKWEQISPELVKLMGLKPDQDPIMVLGEPTIFQ